MTARHIRPHSQGMGRVSPGRFPKRSRLEAAVKHRNGDPDLDDSRLGPKLG
jgi:hypothetical protein